MQSYRLLKRTIELLKADYETTEKEEIAIEAYKMLFPGKGALSEFYVWDNDFSTRKVINEPFESIHQKLWEMMRDYC